MEHIKKALDIVVGQNYERKDLSKVIMLKDGYERPLLRSIGVTRAKGLTHYWMNIGLNAPTGSSASYNEGDKPKTDNNQPDQLSNVVARFGKTARVTDTMAAVWTGAGAYTLADGELARLYQEAIDLETTLKTQEVLNEIEWCLVNGDSSNNSTTEGSEVSQFDSILSFITTNVIDNTSAPKDLQETDIRTLAKTIAENKPAMRPNKLYCNTAQKEIINEWKHTITTDEVSNQLAGFSVAQYDTGYGIVDVVEHPWWPTGTIALINDRVIKRADLIPLGAEPLARINTSLERMVTCETTVEVRAENSMGKILGLNQ